MQSPALTRMLRATLEPAATQPHGLLRVSYHHRPDGSRAVPGCLLSAAPRTTRLYGHEGGVFTGIFFYCPGFCSSAARYLVGAAGGSEPRRNAAALTGQHRLLLTSLRFHSRNRAAITARAAPRRRAPGRTFREQKGLQAWRAAPCAPLRRPQRGRLR